VIDASAIVAIAFNAPEATAFEQRIADDPVRPISAATVLEAAIVIEAKLGRRVGLSLISGSTRSASRLSRSMRSRRDLARRAWRRYGRKRGPAGLNFRDCFSYALAALRQVPLLFKGDDFSKTDIEAV
jgi:ribonuclease VapC